MNVRELLARGSIRLADQPAGRLETEILLSAVLGAGRSWLYANPEHVPKENQASRFLDLVERRRSGEPVAYLTGFREFWSMPLKVTSGVLIPRPETELLVETVLAVIPPDAAWRVVDVGTGSGAIAVAIARERPLCEVHATDISEAALNVARENARTHVPGRIMFHHGSWLQPLKGKFRVIVSNPPYIAPGDPHLLQGDCRFEPPTALTAGNDGMEALQHIAREALDYLETGARLVFEHGFDQGSNVRALLAKLGYQDVETQKDLENRERVSSGTWR